MPVPLSTLQRRERPQPPRDRPSPPARTGSGTSWNGSFPKTLTGSAVSNSAGTVTGSSRGASLRARAGYQRPGWRARASRPFFNHSCARREGKAYGSGDGTERRRDGPFPRAGAPRCSNPPIQDGQSPEPGPRRPREEPITSI